MGREGEAPGERRGGKSSKRRRKEDNSSSRMDDESAATSEIEEDETLEDESATAEIEEEETSEDEEGNSTPTEMDLEGLGPPLTDEDILTSYRECWEYTWGDDFGDFEQTTTVSSMLSTYEPINWTLVTSAAVQVYSIKVVKTKLMWPLQVYGLVAARDSVDHNRNLLFCRKRENCQIITEKDPYLLLTGPSRAIVLVDPVDFEIQLKVKGESEDKEALITQFYRYTGTNGWPLGIRWSNNLCRIDLHFKKLISTVQATIIHARVGGGSWPCEHGGTVVACDFSSEKVVLLDFPDGTKAPVDSDGYLDLSRRVVSVDSEKGMKISVKAYSISGDKKVTVCSGYVMFRPQESGLTQRTCHLDDNFLVEIRVAWSVLVRYKPQP